MPPRTGQTINITSLTIRNCLDCEYVQVKFSRRDNVHVIVYNVVKGVPKTIPAVTPVAQAILLLCTLTYPDEESLSKLPQLVLGKGLVSMTFEVLPLNPGGVAAPVVVVDEEDSDLDMEPCTSKQAKERQKRREDRKAMRAAAARSADDATSNIIHVTVQRRFCTAPGSVFVQINSGETKDMTMTEFHKKYFVRSLHSLNYLRLLHKQCAGNWLQVIHSEPDAYRSFKQQDCPFETFIRLFDRKAMAPQDFICRLATSCLQVNETVRLSERRFVLNVFDEVRQIFEYITVNEYTVWFLVPSHRGNEDQPVNLDDFDLTKVRTCIRAAGDDSNIFWNYTNHDIKDILMVAFQLALASYANQSVLVLSHMEKMSEFVTMQYVTASFMNDIYLRDPAGPKYYCHRYLQRIVDMAMFLGTIVIIEYPSAFTLLQGGRQLIKCFQTQPEGGALEWEIFDGVVKDDESDIQFLKRSVRIN